MITNTDASSTIIDAGNLSIALFEWWHVLIIIFALAIGIIAIITVASKLGKGELDFFWFMRKKDKDVVEIEKLSLKKTLLMFSKYTIEELNIKNRGTLGSQMMKAEEYLLVIKDNTLAKVTIKLKGRLGEHESIIRHPDYLAFKLALQEYITRVKDVIREACINNGFTKKDQVEYSKYVMRMNKRINGMAFTFFTENYIGNVLDSGDIFSKEFLDDQGEIIVSLFDSIRKISFEKEKEIAIIEDRKNDLIETDFNIKWE